MITVARNILIVLCMLAHIENRLVAANASPTIAVSTPNLSTPWSGTKQLTIKINDKIDTYTNIYTLVVDGVVCGDRAYYNVSSSFTYSLNTANLANGPHELYVRVAPQSAKPADYGQYGPVSFTTDNGHLPWQIRSNYRELWLTPGQSLSLAAKLVFTDKTESPIAAASVAFSSANPAVVSIDRGGNVAARALGDTTITLTARGLNNTINVHVNPENTTAHFGKDGSILTHYEPSKSIFVRSMFGAAPSILASDSGYVAAFHAAQVNTLESGFYLPTTGFKNVMDWEKAFDGYMAPTIASMARDNNFSILLTGDDIARGSDAVYQSSRGPSASWSPNPITYAFNWAKGLGKVIGVEMVDEISSSFSGPFPEGQLGRPNGPTQISCVSDKCVVSWTNPIINGALKFLITGASTNPSLNRQVTNLYTLADVTTNGFSFVSKGIGTQTFTSTTDPNLILQVFAATPEPPGGMDYVHNDAFKIIRSFIDRVPGHPPITWPAAGAAPPFNVGAWEGDRNISDYVSLYWYVPSTNYVDHQASLPDMLKGYIPQFVSKYPVIQKNRPTLWEGAASGSMYGITGVSVPIAAVKDNTIVFSQPHGISKAAAGAPRFSVSGNSNSAYNGRFNIYSVVDPYTVKVFVATSNLTGGVSRTGNGGTATFEDGRSFPITSVNFTTYNTNSISFSTNSCPGAARLGALVNVSGNSYGPFNINWYLINFNASLCQYQIEPTPTGTGNGGTAMVVADSYYHAGLSRIMAGGSTPSDVATSPMYAAEEGMAGVRMYNFAGDENRDSWANSLFDGEPGGGDGIQPGTNPLYNGEDSKARWHAMSNAFNLISQIEPYLLQAKLNSPDYGPYMITGARTSSYGSMLMMTNFLEAPVTETVDLSEYNRAGKQGTMYRMNAKSLDKSAVSGHTQKVTFAPGDTIVYIFPAVSASGPDARSGPANTQPRF